MIAVVAAVLAAGAAQVEGLLDEWDLPGAEQLAADLDPGRDRSKFALGRLYFQQGRYEEAAAILARAVAASPDPEWKLYLSLADSAADATRGFQSESSPGGHFEIYFKPGKDQILAPYLGEALEAARAQLEKDFGFAPSERVRVEIFPSVIDLARVSTLTTEEIETSGVIAICKWNRLMVVSPRALVFGYPWLDAASHEYVHYVVSRLTRDRVPIWLHEGIAKLKEQRWREPGQSRAPLTPTQEHLLATALKKDALIPLASLHPSIAKLPSQEAATQAFAQVATLIEHLEQRAGNDAVRRVLEAIGEGVEVEQAVAAVSGQPLRKLVQGWKRSLKRRGLKTRPNLGAVGLKFRRDGDKDESDDDQQLDPSRHDSPRVRNLARLGTLLEERGRRRAAATEYEKALTAARGPLPRVTRRLASIYLELGDSARALEAAKSTARFYPEFAGPHVIAGRALIDLGKSREAVAELQAALRISPFDPRVHCSLAEAYRESDSARAEREAAICRSLR